MTEDEKLLGFLRGSDDKPKPAKRAPRKRQPNKNGPVTVRRSTLDPDEVRGLDEDRVYTSADIEGMSDELKRRIRATLAADKLRPKTA